MRITNVGYNYRHPSSFCINRPFGSGDYILLIIKTEAFFCFEGQRTVVPPNSAIIFKKGTPQLYGAVNNEFVNDWIHFDIDELEEKFITDLGIPFDTIIHPYDINTLLSFIKNIFFERYSQNPRKEDTMKRYFELILIKLSEGIGQKASEYDHPYYDTLCKLRNEIRLAPQSSWTIDEICKKINLSRSYLQHLYKLFFNTGIISDIQIYRIEHAKYLLSSTDMTVTAISQSCGYDNGVHFMRIFKKVTGMTPTEFRNSFRISSNEIRKSKNEPPFSI